MGCNSCTAPRPYSVLHQGMSTNRLHWYLELHQGVQILFLVCCPIIIGVIVAKTFVASFPDWFVVFSFLSSTSIGCLGSTCVAERVSSTMRSVLLVSFLTIYSRTLLPSLQSLWYLARHVTFSATDQLPIIHTALVLKDLVCQLHDSLPTNRIVSSFARHIFAPMDTPVVMLNCCLALIEKSLRLLCIFSPINKKLEHHVHFLIAFVFRRCEARPDLVSGVSGIWHPLRTLHHMNKSVSNIFSPEVCSMSPNRKPYFHLASVMPIFPVFDGFSESY